MILKCQFDGLDNLLFDRQKDLLFDTDKNSVTRDAVKASYPDIEGCKDISIMGDTLNAYVRGKSTILVVFDYKIFKIRYSCDTIYLNDRILVELSQFLLGGLSISYLSYNSGYCDIIIKGGFSFYFGLRFKDESDVTIYVSGRGFANQISIGNGIKVVTEIECLQEHKTDVGYRLLSGDFILDSKTSDVLPLYKSNARYFKSILSSPLLYFDNGRIEVINTVFYRKIQLFRKEKFLPVQGDIYDDNTYLIRHSNKSVKVTKAEDYKTILINDRIKVLGEFSGFYLGGCSIQDDYYLIEFDSDSDASIVLYIDKENFSLDYIKSNQDMVPIDTEDMETRKLINKSRLLL